MTFEELIKVCQDAIDNPEQSMGIVVLVAPRPKHGNPGRNLRMLGQMCKILGSNKDGLLVAAKPHKVLNWIRRMNKEENVRSSLSRSS